jgi:hypothetical protein
MADGAHRQCIKQQGILRYSMHNSFSSKLTAIAVGALLVSLQPAYAQELHSSSKAEVKNEVAAAHSAPVIQIPATVTSMTSSATRMVSYRDQNHSWQTSDGAVHLVINLGSSPSGDGLALYSSFNNGTTWTQMFTLPYTDGLSTDDGVLTNTATGATLQLVYGTSPNVGSIMYATATYNSATQSWTLVSTQTAYSATGVVATNPAFAGDSSGNLWCGFTAETSATEEYQEDLIYLAAGTKKWVNTGLIFGQADNTSQHSARPVPYAGGIGVVYQDELTLYWAYRLNSFAVNEPWVSTMMYVGLPAEGADPYDTHYSVVADSNDNLYLAFISAPADLSFAIFSSSANSWGPMQILETSTNSPGYPQVSIAGGNLLLMANYINSVEVMQSTNFGVSFTETQMLTHPAAVSGGPISYNKPRVETPRYATSPVPVWQQFVDGTTDQLLFFQVPVIN